MRLRLNGRDVDFSGSSVGDLIGQFAPGTGPLVVEKNGTIVPAGNRDSEPLADGDVVELVRLVGGG